MSNKKILDNIPSQEWVHARQHYLGGSEVGAALGESQWTTPFQLWLVKTGRREPIYKYACNGARASLRSYDQ